MSHLTREEKLASFQQLTKVDGIKTGREFAESFSNKARILIDHPHSYREWTIIGPSSVRGFYYLKSTFPLDAGEKYSIQTSFTLCLHESDFERI